MERTIINYYGKQTNRCGYCRNTECSKTYGMHAHNLAPDDYQDLIDRGWRRSGHYCYKPDNEITCCPCYTIRCDVNEFKLSKSHKKILKRMNRFLRDGKRDKIEETSTAKQDDTLAHKNSEHYQTSDKSDEPEYANICNRDITMITSTKPDITDKESANLFERNSQETLEKLKPFCKKAKQLRRERKEAKLKAKGYDHVSQEEKAKDSEKSLKDYVQSASPTDRHKLKLELVVVASKQFMETLQDSYGVYERYQTIIHNEQSEDVMEYLRFLQRSPLKNIKYAGGPACGYGSFHQQYWLDDKLIAVGVIDILPHCISSVYFFYDPDYSFLSLGTYGSLREIEFVQEISKTVPSLKYYYMGYYIHTCPKMKYKGKLRPSYLLCPETYVWIKLDNEIQQQMDARKYIRLNSNLEAKDMDVFSENHLDLVLLLIENKSVITYRDFVQLTGENDREAIMEYGKLVGKKCAHRMLYVKI